MTLETLARLLGLNVGYLVVGWALLWAGGAGRTWRQLLRLGGLGYLAAVALSGIIWVELLIVGVPFRWWTVVATPLLILVVAIVAGHVRGRKPPHGHLTRGADVAVASVVGVAAAGVFLEALFRAARLQSLQAYDAWAFWLPKAKMIHTGGGLDPELLGRLPWPGYPLLGPVLDAAAFTAMGAEDVVTLHVQFWCFTVGFVWAVAGVLTPRVTAWLLWPFLVLALVVPRIGERFLMPQADYLLDFSCVVAALALALWLDSEDRRWLVVALLFLSAAVLTKREGLMLAFCILAATFLASSDRWRSAWPRLAAIGVATALVAVPWRLWYRSNGLAGEGPGGGLLSLDGREGRFVRPPGWPSTCSSMRRGGVCFRRCSSRCGRRASGEALATRRLRRGSGGARHCRRHLGELGVHGPPDHRRRGRKSHRPLHRGHDPACGRVRPAPARTGVAGVRRGRSPHEGSNVDGACPRAAASHALSDRAPRPRRTTVRHSRGVHRDRQRR